MAQPVKFYTDEHVSRAVIRGLRQRGADVLTVPEAGLLGAADEVHVQRALIELRVIFTQDQDFLRLHSAGVAHAGIAYASQFMPIGDVIRGLMLIHQVMTAEEMQGHLEYL